MAYSLKVLIEFVAVQKTKRIYSLDSYWSYLTFQIDPHIIFELLHFSLHPIGALHMAQKAIVCGVLAKEGVCVEGSTKYFLPKCAIFDKYVDKPIHYNAQNLRINGIYGHMLKPW